jgi:hypothetical protein
MLIQEQAGDLRSFNSKEGLHSTRSTRIDTNYFHLIHAEVRQTKTIILYIYETYPYIIIDVKL